MAITRTISLSDFQRRLLTFAPELEEKVVRGLYSASMRMVGVVVQSIDDVGAVDRGELRQSVGAERLPDGGRVYVSAPHAPHIEYGTRPGHSPPLAPLARWALRKGLADDEEEAMGIAQSIAGKFRRYGMTPRGFMAKSYEQAGAIAKAEVEAELAK